jgi:hypothetical protein
MFGIGSIQFALTFLSKNLQLINVTQTVVWQYFYVGGDETENREKRGFGFQAKTAVSVFRQKPRFRFFRFP